MDGDGKKRKSESFRLRDILVILFCLAGAAFSINLFRMDLFQTISAQNIEPVGTITIRNNNVQRRLGDRVLWSRLFVESPVYLGDLIRVADLSGATLHINGNDIDINENTLIRISAAPGEDGKIQIDLNTGTLNLSIGEESGGLALNLMGSRIEARPGTVLSAAVTGNALAVQVNEGSVTVTGEDGQSRSLETGAMLTMDNSGIERLEPAVVVTRPRPNARFLTDSREPLNIGFAWNRINMEANETLLLEIAADRNFSRIVHAVESGDRAAAALGAGLWHWRLLHEGAVLGAGHLTVADSSIAALISPIQDSIYRYRDTPPALRFEWAETEGASHYILEAGPAPDLGNPLIRRQTSAPSLVESNLAEGTWYWRVQPVFPSLYEGSAAYSSVASFRIEQQIESGTGPEETTLTLVLPGLTPEPPPEEELLMMEEEPVLIALPQTESPVLITVPADSGPVAVISPPQTARPQPTPPPPSPARPPQETPPTPRETAPPPSLPPPQETPPPAAFVPPSEVQTPEPQPLLPEPQNRLPASGYIIEFEEMRNLRRIDFNWSGVPEANAYIFTLYQQSAGGLRQIIRDGPFDNAGWTLDDLGVLERGTFVWRVEAVSVNRNGDIERQGRAGENSFILDIPPPGRIQIEDIGVLYGQ